MHPNKWHISSTYVRYWSSILILTQNIYGRKDPLHHLFVTYIYLLAAVIALSINSHAFELYKFKFFSNLLLTNEKLEK